MSNNVQIGCEVRDTVTGFTGIVTAMSKTLNIGPRATVCPKASEDNKFPESIILDLAVLERIGDGVVSRTTAAAPHPYFVGDQIRSTLRRDDTGTITSITEHLNGCVVLEVERFAFDRSMHEKDYFTISVHSVEPLEKPKQPAEKNVGTGASTGGTPQRVAKTKRMSW